MLDTSPVMVSLTTDERNLLRALLTKASTDPRPDGGKDAPLE